MSNSMDWESYPIGLKVLAVDDDPLCLKVVERMLKRCRYDVFIAENGREALAKLRAKDSQIDLVLSDVYMPDMDGFKLLETIALELDIPVIMMSSNGETPVVLRGVTHGAVDFLIKPVRIEELRNVWQHVVRRRGHQGINSREYSGDDGEMVDGNRADKKRKESPAQAAHEADDTSSAKKPRVVWSVEMHQQFVNAVNSLGIDKAVPKRILDQMNVEGLTRENVASHLQKYRLYLKRVSGVQTGSGGRGKGGAGMGGLEGHAYPPMMMGGHMGPPGGLDMGAMDAMNEQEELKLQLQMRHMQMEQAGRAERALKEEAAMPASSLPFKVEANLGPGGLPGAVYPMGQPLGGLHGGLPMESLTSAVGSMPHTPTFDTSSLSYPQQAYPAAGMHGMTSGDLVYPEAHMPHMHPPPLNPGMPHSLSQDYLLEGFGTGGEGLQPNGQSEQEMEKFIDTFLQPND